MTRHTCDGAGSLTRDFKHLSVDMYLIEEEGVKKLRVDAHFSKRKQLAAIRTTCSHVQVQHGARILDGLGGGGSALRQSQVALLCRWLGKV